MAYWPRSSKSRTTIAGPASLTAGVEGGSAPPLSLEEASIRTNTPRPAARSNSGAPEGAAGKSPHRALKKQNFGQHHVNEKTASLTWTGSLKTNEQKTDHPAAVPIPLRLSFWSGSSSASPGPRCLRSVVPVASTPEFSTAPEMSPDEVPDEKSENSAGIH